MILYMKSSTFIDDFIENEDDVDILMASYICVSTNIRRREDSELLDITIASKSTLLYPSSRVFSCETIESMRDAYMEQLQESCLPFLSLMIKKSIKKGKNFILICSDKEWKIPYLKWVSEFVYDYFEYPIYSYKNFVSIEKLPDIDDDSILKRINKILEKTKRQNLDKMSSREKTRLYKEMKTSSLKKILKEKGLYNKNMSRSEMIDMLDAFA